MTEVREVHLIGIFRLLVVAATASYLVWFFLPYLATDLERQIAAYSGHGAVLPVRHPVYYGSWLLLWLVAASGLVLLHNWARQLYLVLVLLGPVLAPFSGYVIQPPLDSMFSSASLLFDGAVIAIAYLSPVSGSFKKAR